MAPRHTWTLGCCGLGECPPGCRSRWSAPSRRSPYPIMSFWPPHRDVSPHPSPRSSPPTELDGLLKPLLIHGLLHILRLGVGREMQHHDTQVCREGSRTPTQRAGMPDPPPTLVLTTWTHSMSGSRTDWFPERLTTQAGVSGVASSSAITASIPILLLCKGKGAPTAPLTPGPPMPARWDAPLGSHRDGPTGLETSTAACMPALQSESCCFYLKTHEICSKRGEMGSARHSGPKTTGTV